ncbi:MAG: maleylacetoacetate isomerase [Burkholderiaceae bacterium]
MLKLHNYFRSSASFRVRIALNFKGLDYQTWPTHLLRGGGEQLGPAFRALNPAALVPVLEDGSRVLTQSIAIIEYLEELHPEPALLPRDPWARAQVRALALAVACEIHPLNNLRVLQYLGREMNASDEQKRAWARHWIETGFAQLDAMLAPVAGRYAVGDAISLADVLLVPQVFNARRFDCRLDTVPRVMRVFDACMALPAFIAAQPARQPDAE